MLFENGSQLVRADFHLHTRSDKEFKFSGDGTFVDEYLAALAESETRVGVIANHNKFNWDEFKQLRREGAKQEMLILPGIELSVNDGAKGIHSIIVFSNDWLVEKYARS